MAAPKPVKPPLGRGSLGLTYLYTEQPDNSRKDFYLPPTYYLKVAFLPVDLRREGSKESAELKGILRLKHPTLAPKYGFAFDQDYLHVFSEVCEDNLRDYTRYRVLDIGTVWQISRDILDGLIYLHDTAKVAHSSLQPRNVLLHGGAWKLCDYGMAKPLGIRDKAQ